MMIFVADALSPGPDAALLTTAVLDEVAHLATGALLVLVLRPSSRHRAVAILVASVAIDVDHVPAQLGWNGLTEGTPRPYTHALWLPLLAYGCSLTARGRTAVLLAGASLGMLGHLWRDLCTGPGAALIWPLSHVDVSLSYWPYGVSIAALAAAATHQSNAGRER